MELKEKTAGLVDHVEELAGTIYKLGVVKVTEKVTDIAAGAVAAIAISLFGLIAIIFGGVALSWWLGDLVNSRALGFLLGAVFFVLIAVIVVSLRKSIIFPTVRNNIIGKVYENAD